MAVKTTVVTVTTTATLLSGTDPGDHQGAANGMSLAVKVPSGGATVYVGGSDVTADTTAGTGGFPVAAGEGYAFDLDPGDVLYGRVAAATQAVNVLRTGV